MDTEDSTNDRLDLELQDEIKRKAAMRDQIANKAVNSFLEHYDLPHAPASVSHLHDCITSAIDTEQGPLAGRSEIEGLSRYARKESDGRGPDGGLREQLMTETSEILKELSRSRQAQGAESIWE